MILFGVFSAFDIRFDSVRLRYTLSINVLVDLMLKSMLKKISRALSTSTLLFMITVYLTQAGWHRALTPSFFGMQEIAPRIYTDSPERSGQITEAIKKAEYNSLQFFTEISARPTYIICLKSNCEEIFGRMPLGLTLGYHRVLISPKGFTPSVLNHERIHVDLHALMGFQDLYRQRFPAWFDEGLSEFLSGRHCSFQRHNEADLARVLRADTFRDWNAMVADRAYGRHYGAACELVSRIAQATGIDGLRRIVLTVRDKDDFMRQMPSIVRR
ncbi:hypothetical protein GCM10007939_12700 [Amylibacter marinus]|uniref:Peptidase MA superfamily protein n=2 Tax=Amylibacter marinus TaxID=1475483 RepID=A0ABQ5VUQ6_9RHOB|nr:hypothetical protein GCM10007939_12700 [Amylibacter marinus]